MFYNQYGNIRIWRGFGFGFGSVLKFLKQKILRYHSMMVMGYNSTHIIHIAMHAVVFVSYEHHIIAEQVVLYQFTTSLFF